MEESRHIGALKDQWTCHVCGLHLSRKQRLQGHIRSKHPNTELPDHLKTRRGMYKMYNLDESVSVPERTKFRHKSEALSNHENICGEPVHEEMETINEEVEIIVDYPTNENFPSSTSIETNESNRCNSSQEKCMAVLSYISKMRLTGTASEQLIRLLNIFGSTEISSVQLKQTLNGIVKSFDYCEICSRLFPDDKESFHCAYPACSGLRYSGPIDQQHLHRPKLQFASASLRSQILDIIGRNSAIRSGPISLTMNTDGVPLYKASSVSLWPVFLVVNELPPNSRFLVQNVIVWGIWQGQGKPVFRSFLEPLTTEINSLHLDGIMFEGKKVDIKLTCVTMDLQAKAQVMEMVPHNGQCSCITCETPGLIAKKGKGHTKCFPVADPCPPRSSSSVLKNAEDAIVGGLSHVKGIKDVSVLFNIDHFDPVDGVVPDYMHGVLLGTAKKLMKLWFSKTTNGSPFNLLKQLKEVDARLKKMKPTDNISRLPRSIEGHLSHWKASELQHWLLFYSIPCLKGILPPPFFENLCFLVEGVYKLLGDTISSEDIDHAELSLTKFQISFETLYGKNNCGLNLHNIGCHLANYARTHGPLWAWSCFAFEDMNGILLKSAHGTGNVCKQLLQKLLVEKNLHSEAHAIKDENLREFTLDMLSTGKRTKTKLECNNCRLLGKLHAFNNSKIEDEVKKMTGHNLCILNKVLRIKLNGQLIASKRYKRLTKRNCHTVLMTNGLIKSVEFFVHDEISDKCFAYVKQLNVTGCINESVSHLICVEEDRINRLVLVDQIVEKVICLEGNEDFICVARLPTIYNHCV